MLCVTLLNSVVRSSLSAGLRRGDKRRSDDASYASAYDQRSFRVADVRSDTEEPRRLTRSEPQRTTVSDPRRAADRWRDLSDAELTARLWDEPATPDVQLVTSSVRRFGQLQNLSVPDNLDDPLSDAGIAAWEGDCVRSRTSYSGARVRVAIMTEKERSDGGSRSRPSWMQPAQAARKARTSYGSRDCSIRPYSRVRGGPSASRKDLRHSVFSVNTSLRLLTGLLALFPRLVGDPGTSGMASIRQPLDGLQ